MSDAAQAAANLLEYLEQFQWPEGKPFPADLSWDEKRMKVYGTTVDGVRESVTLDRYYKDLSAGEVAYGIPLFSRPVRDKIVELVSQLEGAPAQDATGPMGEPLFPSKGAWWFYCYRIGVLVWGGMINPPGLDLEAFPHRKNIEELVWRWRSAEHGFVHHAFLAFMKEVAEARVSGSELKKFERTWVEEFTKGERTFMIEGDTKPKTMDDFSVGGQPGTASQFQSLWKLVKQGKSKSTKRPRGAK